MVQSLGYSRGADGMFHDAAGQPLVVEMRIEGADINNKAALAIMDGWQGVGIGVRPQPFAAGASNQWLYTYPGFWIRRGPSDIAGLRNLHSSRIPLAENNYRPGHVSRYAHPELDGLLDRYCTTIPRQERVDVRGQVLDLVADQLPELPLLFDVEPTVYSRRLANVTGRWPAAVRTSTQAWNAHEWEIVSRP